MLIALVAAFTSTAVAQDASRFRYVGSYAPDGGYVPPGAVAVQPGEPASLAGCAVSPSCEAALCAAKVCRLEISTEKPRETCFEVTCEPICIPPVTFPWEKSPCCAGCDGAAACAPSRCGRVKHVHVLGIRETEGQERCVCKWKLEDACVTGCGSLPEQPVVPPPPTAARSLSPQSPLATRPPQEARGPLAWLRFGSRN
jgi:hypothetical protein